MITLLDYHSEMQLSKEMGILSIAICDFIRVKKFMVEVLIYYPNFHACFTM